MAASTGRAVEVYRIHPATLWVAALGSLILQSILPIKVPLARLIDLPLLVTIYFALVRRSKVFGMALGTALGLLQDALAHGYIGTFGIAKALVGYFAASASVRFELDSLLARSLMTGVFALMHSLCLVGLQHALLDFPPPFQPLDIASSVLVNIALGLVVFLILDRFKHPA